MKQKYNNKNNKKNAQVKETKPFEGLIKQLERETLVLVNILRRLSLAVISSRIAFTLGAVPFQR